MPKEERKRVNNNNHHGDSYSNNNKRQRWSNSSTSTTRNVPRSSISDYIITAAQEIQKKKEKEENEKLNKNILIKSSRGRWDSSDEENEESTEDDKRVDKRMVEEDNDDDKRVGEDKRMAEEDKDDDDKRVVQEKDDEGPAKSEWLQDLEEDDEDEGEEKNSSAEESTVVDKRVGVQESNDVDKRMNKKEGNDADKRMDETRESHNPLFHGCRSVECYQRLNYIDEGTYGLVFRAKDRQTNEEVALKQIKFDSKHTSKVGFPITALRETNILLSLNHPNIVRVKEMVVGSSIDKIYMVMEFLDNDLKACMDMSETPFSISEVKRLMLQLLGAVDHMHQHWYIHRDLKTSNLLYSNKDKKLAVCDFGMARKYGRPLNPYTFEVITLWYRCPELLLGQRTYSTAVDMWSIGCIFAELLLRKPLFMGEGEVDQLNKIFKIIGAPTEERWPGYVDLPMSGKIGRSISSKSKLKSFFPTTSFGGGISLSEAGFDLISNLLLMNPEKRISAEDALKHPWFFEQPYPCPVELMPTFEKNDHGDHL